jgi:REP element-mobilizing transposase RayT
MPQSLARVLLHIVFSTKSREPWIEARIRPLLHAYLGGTSRDLGCPALAVGGVEDHVHVLLSLSRTKTIADVVEEMKTASSKWMKRQGSPDFWWQLGYAAYSVSQSHAARVVRYIALQEEHHAKKTYQDELRELLRLHQVDYDEGYVWD